MLRQSAVTAAICRLGNGRIAVIVAGIDDLDADRTGIDVGLAGPGRFAGMPSTLALLNELHDAAVLMDKVVAGHIAAGSFEQLERGVGISHARCSAAKSYPGRRPSLRSPKFGDGSTSATTHESGANTLRDMTTHYESESRRQNGLRVLHRQALTICKARCAGATARTCSPWAFVRYRTLKSRAARAGDEGRRPALAAVRSEVNLNNSLSLRLTNRDRANSRNRCAVSLTPIMSHNGPIYPR